MIKNLNQAINMILTIIIVVACIIGILIYVAVKQSAKDGNCNSMKKLYANNSNVRPVLLSKQLTYTINDTEYETRLRDMYIKSSYNSCSAGDYRDDWVSTCALNEVLKQGCRFIDFEIYSVNHKPVVATSTTIKKCIPELADDVNCLMSNNIDILIDKIMHLIRNKNQKNYLIKNGKKVLNNYLPNKSAQKIFKDLKKTI